jgi:hypothetical protein
VTAPTEQELRNHLLPLLTAAGWAPAAGRWVLAQRSAEEILIGDDCWVHLRRFGLPWIRVLVVQPNSLEQAVAHLRAAGALPAEEPEYEPAVMHGGHSAAWIHGCGHLEAWPTDPKYPPITEQGCDACESAPDGSWRQLYVRREGAGRG